MNYATHYIDGSQIYGSDDYTASALRSYTSGTLKSIRRADDQKEFCPHLSVGSSSGSNAYSSNSGKTTSADDVQQVEHHRAIGIYLTKMTYRYGTVDVFSCRQFARELEPRNGTFPGHVFEIPQLCSVKTEKYRSRVVRRNIVPRISENRRRGHSTRYVRAVFTNHFR